MKKRVAVLGAGPTGLAATWKLAHHDLEIDLFEKEPKVGGLGGSITHGQYTVDYGPHVFHVSRGEVYPLIRSIYDQEVLLVPRKTRMIIGKKSFTYPFRFLELISGLSPFLTLRIFFSYVAQLVRNKINPQPLDSFEAWGINRFGRVLYELCFGNYTAKVWGIPTNQLSVVLGKEKIVNKLSLMNFIKNMLGFNNDKDQFTHYQDFVYCYKGSGHFYEELAKSVQNMGAKVHTNTKIKQIHHDGKRVKAITYEENNATKTVEYDYVLTSIPLASLMNLLTPAPPREYVEIANQLKYRTLILVYLVVAKDYATDAHWTYLLDSRFIFNRVTEQKQFSRYSMENNTSVVCFEICCNKGDELWSTKDENLYKMTLDEVDKLEGMPYFKRDQVIDYFVIRKDHAYPLFDIGYDAKVSKTFEYLKGFKNLISTGRNGLFVNNNMHSNMIYGIESAQRIINELNKVEVPAEK